MWPGPRPPPYQVGHNIHGPKIGGGAPLGGDGSPFNNVARTEAYLRTKWYLGPYSRLATIDMGRKVGAAVVLFGELGPHLTQCGLGRGLPSCQVSS